MRGESSKPRPLGRPSRALGTTHKRLSGYVHLTPGYTNSWRVRYRIPKYMPGHTGKDLCIGHYPTEELAVLTLDIFLAAYCLEFPEAVMDMKWMFRSSEPNCLRDIAEMFPIVATQSDIDMWCNINNDTPP